LRSMDLGTRLNFVSILQTEFKTWFLRTVFRWKYNLLTTWSSLSYKFMGWSLRFKPEEGKKNDFVLIML
jgi:hypothetical protein